MGDAYDGFIQALLNGYARAPWDWEDCEPGPMDHWHGWAGTDTRFARNKQSGVIIAVPSEGNVMTTGTATNSSVGGIGTGQLPPLSPLSSDETYRSKVKLGEKYRETQTGFEGYAIAVVFYQNACERVELENFDKKRGLEAIFFDAKRLVHVETGKKLDDAQAPGGPERGNPGCSTPKR